ncbi:hypothetical protein K474DRAFT_1707581 [Panus rudis PR-1116 ss-1]|nr:hypothetical protein K474DRAFT_1707581 [Panus rudis PR-1116 ss-1]
MIPPPPGFLLQFLGGFIVTACVGLVFYGLTVAQAVVYSHHAADDPKWMKIIVILVILFDSLHATMLIRVIVYYGFVISDDLEAMAWTNWTYALGNVCNTLIVFLVQCFYIRRIWLLSAGSVSLICISAFLVLSRLGFFIVLSAFTFQHRQWVTFHQSRTLSALVDVSGSIALATDSWLSLCILYFLRKNRARFQRTEGILRWLMIYTVNTGLLSAIISTCVLVSFAKLQQSLLFVGFLLLEGRLSANSIFGILNARLILRKRANNVLDIDVELSDMGIPQVQLPTRFPQPRRIEIFQETVQITDTGHVDLGGHNESDVVPSRTSSSSKVGVYNEV